MKILLVKLKEPTRPGQRACYMPPLGLWGMRAALRREGHECEVIDMHLGDEISGSWDVIGISAQFSVQHDEYIQVVREARYHASHIIAGGFHAAAVPPPPGVDYVHKGPGEDLTGLSYTAPDMTEAELSRYWERGAPHDLVSKSSRWMSIETSRGCIYGCGYCGVGKFWGGWRQLDRVVVHAYLKHLSDDLNVDELFIEDDNATRSGNLEDLLPELKRFYWSMPNGVRISDLSPALLERMSAAGCWRLSLPFETGSRRTADLMNIGDKWLGQTESRALVADCRNNGIRTCGFFIIGYPGETFDDVMRTLDFANTLPLDDRHIYIATPYPGTPLYDLCKREGYLIADGPELYEALMYNRALIRTPWIEPEDLERIREEDREAAIARKLGG